MSAKDGKWAILILPFLVMAIAAVGGPLAWPHARGWIFLLMCLMLIVVLALVGRFVNGRAEGVFIDNRNRMSLSKLQACAWTVVVLAAFATAAAYNVYAPGGGLDTGTVKALAITIPDELLLAMGISATSLVATPSLLSLKAAEDPAPEDVEKAKQRVSLNSSDDSDAKINLGKLAIRPEPEDASWADLFTGDEVGNDGSPDLGKIQQLLITLILLGAYVIYLLQTFSSPTVGFIGALPALDKSFVWLLGISHASYLAYKAAPHTQTATQPKADPHNKASPQSTADPQSKPEAPNPASPPNGG